MLKFAAPVTNPFKIISQNIEIGSHLYIKPSDALDPFFVRKIPAWKRLMDIFGSILGLILFAPVFLLIPLIIKVVSPGPVFFKQERIGFGGQEVYFLKIPHHESEL